MATHSSVLAWRIPGMGDLVVCHLWGHTESDMTEVTQHLAQRPTRPSRTNTQKRCGFHSRGLECKVGGQEIPGVTGKFGLEVQNESGQRLIEYCQENSLVIANTLFQQHKRRLYTWTSPDGQHRNQIDYILCSQR